ncbi:MAG: Fe-S cluster assembly sulfur transfer protein SufU, partial [Candidatus Entotheonellia bacterium]
SKRPRNFRVLEEANRKSEGYNPLCGDKITVFLELENGRVKNVGFQGSGCAISTASASVMTESIKGKTLAEAEILFEVFHQLVTGKPPAAGKTPELGKLAAFSGVSEFPARVKCATLAWHTLHAALQGEGDTVSTE